MTRNRLVLALALAAVALFVAPGSAPAADPVVFVTEFAGGDKGGIQLRRAEGWLGAVLHVGRRRRVRRPGDLGGPLV